MMRLFTARRAVRIPSAGRKVCLQHATLGSHRWTWRCRGRLPGFARGWLTQRDVLVEQGVALAVAGMALVGIAVGLSTWREERRRAREEKQRGTDAELVQQLFARFGPDDWDLKREIQLRAEVVTWAHPEVVRPSVLGSARLTRLYLWEAPAPCNLTRLSKGRCELPQRRSRPPCVRSLMFRRVRRYTTSKAHSSTVEGQASSPSC